MQGWQAWDLLIRAQGQLRLGHQRGVVGIDMPAVLQLARSLGYDETAMAILLPYGERGLVKALNERQRTADG